MGNVTIKFLKAGNVTFSNTSTVNGVQFSKFATVDSPKVMGEKVWQKMKIERLNSTSINKVCTLFQISIDKEHTR